MNVFINNKSQTDQYCFVVDRERYYTFNGKYALYDIHMAGEKSEYAQRLGNIVEFKRVIGIYSGVCPACGHELVDVPVVRQSKVSICYCPTCSRSLIPSRFTPIVDILEKHSTQSVFDYDELDLDETDD